MAIWNFRKKQQPIQPYGQVRPYPQDVRITVKGEERVKGKPLRETKEVIVIKEEKKKVAGKITFFIVLILILYAYLGCPFIPFLYGTCDVIKSKAEVAIKKPIEISREFFSREIFSLAKYGEFTDPNVVPEKPREERGVKITRFESDRKYFNEDEGIRLTGLIDVKNVQNDIDLTISCSAENYNGQVEVELISEREKRLNEISTRVPGSAEGITQQVQVRCIFPGSIYTIEKDKIRTGKRFTLNVKYDIVASTILDLYVTNDEQIRRYGVGRTLFERSKDYDSLVRSGLWAGDGEIRSLQIGPKVPISPSIDLIGRQPLTKGSRDIRIGLINTVSDKAIWGGNLDKLIFLELESLNPEAVNIDYGRCQPGFSGNKLSDDTVQRINELIIRYCYSNQKNIDDCTRFRDNLVFDCGISITKDVEGDLLELYKILTTARYTYVVTEDRSVEIRKRESLFAELDKLNNKESIMGAVLSVEKLLKQPIINF